MIAFELWIRIVMILQQDKLSNSRILVAYPFLRLITVKFTGNWLQFMFYFPSIWMWKQLGINANNPYTQLFNLFGHLYSTIANSVHIHIIKMHCSLVTLYPYQNITSSENDSRFEVCASHEILQFNGEYSQVYLTSSFTRSFNRFIILVWFNVTYGCTLHHVKYMKLRKMASKNLMLPFDSA